MLFLNTSWFKTTSLCPSIYATIRSNITPSINLHITHVRLISLQEEEEEEARFPRFSQELYICIFHFVGFHLFFPDDVHLTYHSFYEIFNCIFKEFSKLLVWQWRCSSPYAIFSSLYFFFADFSIWSISDSFLLLFLLCAGYVCWSTLY